MGLELATSHQESHALLTTTARRPWHCYLMSLFPAEGTLKKVALTSSSGTTRQPSERAPAVPTTPTIAPALPGEQSQPADAPQLQDRRKNGRSKFLLAPPLPWRSSKASGPIPSQPTRPRPLPWKSPPVLKHLPTSCCWTPPEPQPPAPFPPTLGLNRPHPTPSPPQPPRDPAPHPTLPQQSPSPGYPHQP